MSFKRLTDITVTKDSNQVAITSAESLSDIIKGDLLQLKGELPVLIESADQTNRTITLQEDWPELTQANVVAAVVPTSADFRASTESVKALTSVATQSVNQWEALTQTVTTVTIEITGEEPVQVDSIPKIIDDATNAGAALMTSAQDALDLMGDAPTFAQAVSDNKDLVISYISTAEDVEVEPGKYSMAHYLAKTTAVQTATAQIKTETQQLKTDVQNIKTETLGYRDTANQHRLDAETALTAVQQVFDNFDDKYLGAHDADPAADNDGDPLGIGMIFFHSAEKTMKFWTGTEWESPELTASQAANSALNYKNQAEAIRQATEALRNESKQLRDEQEALAGGDAANALRLGGETAEQWLEKIKASERKARLRQRYNII